MADLAAEALRVPVGGHRLNHAPDNELATFVAARSKEHMEVSLTVLAALELVEDAVGKCAETLGAPAKRYIECRILRQFETVNMFGTTHTKHWVCHSKPFELTIFSWGSNPSSHRRHIIVANDIACE